MTTGDSTAVRTVQGQGQGQAKAAISTGRKPARPALQLVRKVEVDRTRDALLTDFGKTTLKDRYLLPGESYQDMFARVSTAYADDADHAQRIYDYMSRLWFMPSTPVLVERRRGSRVAHLLLPERRVRQPRRHRRHVERERVAGGQRRRHRHLLGRRALHRGEGEGRGADQSGIIPFIRVMDSLTLAISQGSLRRGSAAVYLDVFHPEIEEFLEIRKPSGDFNRKSLNLHHGISITDEFMEAVRDGAQFALRSPKTHEAVKLVDARTLWQKILEIRLQTGEPYLIFADTVNRALPQHQRELGFSVRQSNLCSEIMLHTGQGSPGARAHRRLLPLLGERGELPGMAERAALHRGRDALPRQCAAGLHRQRPDGGQRGLLCGDARAVGGARPHGLPLLPAGPERAVRVSPGQILEHAHFQAPAPRGRQGQRHPGRRNAAPAPMRRSGA